MRLLMLNLCNNRIVSMPKVGADTWCLFVGSVGWKLHTIDAVLSMFCIDRNCSSPTFYERRRWARQRDRLIGNAGALPAGGGAMNQWRCHDDTVHSRPIQVHQTISLKITIRRVYSHYTITICALYNCHVKPAVKRVILNCVRQFSFTFHVC